MRAERYMGEYQNIYLTFHTLFSLFLLLNVLFYLFLIKLTFSGVIWCLWLLYKENICCFYRINQYWEVQEIYLEAIFYIMSSLYQLRIVLCMKSWHIGITTSVYRLVIYRYAGHIRVQRENHIRHIIKYDVVSRLP